jgi:hypothetical protein
MDQNYQNLNQPYGNQPRQESLPNATLILVFGILSIFVCQLLGIAAWIMGNNSLALYNQNPERYTESSASSVKAGKICGIIGVCLFAAFILLWLVLGVSFLSFWGMKHSTH